VKSKLILTLLLATVTTVTAAAADNAATGHGWLTGRLADYNELRPHLPAAELALRVVDESIDVEHYARRMLRSYVDDALADFEEHLDADEYHYLIDVTRNDVLAALRQRLTDDLAQRLATTGSLSIVDAHFDDKQGTVVLHDDAGTPPFEVLLHRREDGAWRIGDIKFSGGTLSRHYRDRYGETINGHYSPAVLVTELRELDYIVLEDFSSSRHGDLPLGWRWRDRDEDRRKPYRVHSTGDRTYLAAQDSGGSVVLLRFAHWNPRDYPIMTWCWRADSLPAGGDERFGHTNDSAAGIYVFFSQTWIGMPRHIKYVWSTTLAEGTIGRRDRIARPYFVVVESGDQQLGEWLFATVDLGEHYDRTWGGRPKKRTQGIGLLTDANSTHSQAQAYYADLRVWSREAYEAGRVEDYCTCYGNPGLMSKDDTTPATAGEPTRLEIKP
jgi:hypothetical protein